MIEDSGSIARLHILLVEDDAMNRKVTLLMLSRLGYNADAANNGLEVITCFKANTYDLVLMDIVMQEMDGFEASRSFADIGGVWPKLLPLQPMCYLICTKGA
jgi:CheY-like chemotaxis protein